MLNENNQLDNLISFLKNNPNASVASQDDDGSSVEEKLYDITHFHKLPTGKERKPSDPAMPKKQVQLKKRHSSGKQNNGESLKEKLQKRNKEKKEANVSNYFEGKRFTFIPYDMELTPKRIQILSQNMSNRGAGIIPFSMFSWNFKKNGDISVITSRKMPCQYLLEKIPAIFHHEMEQFTFIDCDWVSVCLQNNQLVSSKPYLIEWRQENPYYGLNPRQTKKIGEESQIKPKKEKQEERIGATFLRQQTMNLEQQKAEPTKNEENVPILKEKGIIEIESDNESQDTMIIEQSDEEKETKMEIETPLKNETKKEETIIKSEPQNTAKRDYTYIIDDDDDDLIYGGNSQKRMKLESDDLKGTFLKELDDSDKIKTEVKDYKMIKPKGKTSVSSKNKENLAKVEEGTVVASGEESKPQKEEILLCQVGEHKNLNAHITNELEKMLKVVQIERNQGRIHGYGKAISIFKALPFKVNSVSDIKNISGLGKRMERSIQEIIKTGKLTAAENALGTEKMQVIQLFDDIYGVGPPTALNFYNKGFRTIEDLRKNQHILTNEQKLGLKYFEEFQKKIPRELVTEIFNIVQKKIDEISDYPGQYEAICGGSYRRGRAYCGDVDIIASPKDGVPSKGFCMKLVKSLEGSFLTDHLSLPVSDSEGGETYLGVCYHKGHHRRIDFKICDRERFGPLTIYYTGGDYFNRSMRIEAEKQGYNLDNFGLYPVIRVGDTKHSLQLIPCYTEHDIFRILGLKYVQPEFRDI